MTTLLRFTFVVALITLAVERGPGADTPANHSPNIILILSDDVGYGDVGCYGATKVKTPNIDRLAAQGLRFTQAYATSATCTPSRYSLMTGQYAWRKKGTGILPGNAALIIDPHSKTLPEILHDAGYATGCVGKWHLGLGSGDVDWNGDIKPGPLEVGFDYSFIIPATGDRVPCVFIEGHRVVGFDPNDPIAVSYGIKVGDEPTGRDHPELLTMKPSHGHDDTIINGISRIGFMSGGKSARWKDENIADTLTTQALAFIRQQKDRPFFLYFATHDIHVPRVPNPRFRGTSQCGVRGDVIQQLDWSVGQVLTALDELHIADHTLVIFSSDNGPVVDDGYADGSVRNLNGHMPAGVLRGGKYSIYEGGTRMPFIVRFPGRVQPGVSDAMISQVDLLASFAALAKQNVPPGAAPDSTNVLPALLGDARTARNEIIEHDGFQQVAIRRRNWKLIPAGNFPRRGGRAQPQLYDLAKDPGEQHNLAADEGATVAELERALGAARNP